MQLVKSSFTRKLIDEDKIHSDRQINEAKGLAAGPFEEIRRAYSSFLGRPVKGHELFDILNSNEAPMRLLKQQMNAPNADNETILKMHGTPVIPANQVRTKHHHKIRSVRLDEYEFTDEHVLLRQKAIDRIVESNRYYINNEIAQTAFDGLTKICEETNKLMDLGVISRFRANEIRKDFDNLVTYQKTPKGNSGITVNHKKIDRL